MSDLIRICMYYNIVVVMYVYYRYRGKFSNESPGIKIGRYLLNTPCKNDNILSRVFLRLEKKRNIQYVVCFEIETYNPTRII